MRTLFLVSFCFLQLIASAQNEYFMNSPKWGMIDETQWAQLAPVFGTKTTYFVNGDTLLNGVLFVKIFEEGISYNEGGSDNGWGNGVFTEEPYTNPNPIAFLRSENGSIFKWNTETNLEELLYDFDVTVGDVFPVSTSIVDQEIVVSGISTVFLGGFERKVISTVNSDGNEVFPKIIEGVGTPYGPWHSDDDQLDGTRTFQCYSLNDFSYQVDAEENMWLASSSSACEFVVAVAEFAEQPNTNIYPNPANSALFIESETPIFKIVIRDMAGAKLIEEVGGKSNIQLDLSTMPSGIYLCEITLVNNQKTTTRIVKI
jgi:hypothetical protein